MEASRSAVPSGLLVIPTTWPYLDLNPVNSTFLLGLLVMNSFCKPVKTKLK